MGLPFSALCESDFTSNVDSGLNSKVRRQRLGEVDAFLSHSWHDPPKQKWQVLCAWADTFQRQHGRDPIVWLDKACLNQTDIEAQLVCLPIFLSGCQKLVILAGPTFVERLWCVIEVFTFLKMGGDPERVDFLPYNAPNAAEQHSLTVDDLENGEEHPPADLEEAGRGADVSIDLVLARFRHFDVNETKASKESDRQHLLGVIETGFGELGVFSSLVQSLFANEALLERSTASVAIRGSDHKPRASKHSRPPQVAPHMHQSKAVLVE